MTLDVAILILRIGVAWVFLYAAWKNTETKEARAWTVNETSILFRSLGEDKQKQCGRISAIIGMTMMYAGGISILLGVEPRAGGLVIAMFSGLGIRIHAIRRDEAKMAGAAGNPMGWSAYGAHIAAGLKNWALIGAGIFLVLVGAGSYGMRIDYLARAIAPR